MTTGDIEEASTERNSWLSRGWRWWEKISAFLAIIALVDLTGQLIKWASIIHWLAEKYAAVRAWLFGWLPFHILPEWHDPIVLFLIVVSVTNVGVYQRTGHTAGTEASQVLSAFLRGKEFAEARWFAVVLVFVAALGIAVGEFGNTLLLGVFIIVLFSGVVLLAWRWVLTTAAVFGALAAVNYAWVHWLEKLAERH
jgi:hypothetical protein